MEADHKAIKRILIINLAFIGDVLLSTPVARALRQTYPGAVIDMLVIPLAAPIARGNPYIDGVLEYDKRGKHKKARELWGLVRQLRCRRYDLAVSTNFALRGAVLAWMSGIRYRAGYAAQHAGWFLTHTASRHRPVVRHEAENHLDVLKPLGIFTDDTSLAFKVDPVDVMSLQNKVKRDMAKPLAVICPVGSYRQKSWTTAGVAEFIGAIAPSAECFLIGARSDAAELAEINAAAGDLAGMLPGTLTLGELAAFLAEAKFLLTVDTGPLHIANAVGTPVIALFGPTDPVKWGPRGPRDIVFEKSVECRPCWGRTGCDDNRCLNTLESGDVIAAARRLLGEK